MHSILSKRKRVEIKNIYIVLIIRLFKPACPGLVKAARLKPIKPALSMLDPLKKLQSLARPDLLTDNRPISPDHGPHFSESGDLAHWRPLMGPPAHHFPHLSLESNLDDRSMLYQNYKITIM